MMNRVALLAVVALCALGMTSARHVPLSRTHSKLKEISHHRHGEHAHPKAAAAAPVKAEHKRQHSMSSPSSANMDLERAEKFEHKTTASSMDFFPSAKALSDKSQQLFKAGSAAEPDYVLRMERQMKEMATQLKGLSHEVKELEETNYQATHHAPTAKSMESELEKEKHAKKVAKAVPQAATHKPIAKAPLPASHHTQAKQQHAKPHTAHSKPARSMEEEGEANDNDNDNILANVGSKVVEVGTSVLDKVGSGVDNAIAASAQEGGLLDRFGHSVDSWLGVDREGSSKSKSKSKKMSAKAHSANEGMLNKLSNMMLSEDEDAYGVNDDDY